MQKVNSNRVEVSENKSQRDFTFNKQRNYPQIDYEYSDPSDVETSFEFDEDDVIFEKHLDNLSNNKNDVELGTLNEYKSLIIKNILDAEEEFLPPSDFQRCKTKYRRAILDWLLRVHKEFTFNDDTLFTSIGLFDRISRTLKIKRCHFQLFAATSMWIGAKLQETTTPALSDFIYLCENSYTEKEFLDCERVFCSALRFNLTAPNPREIYMPITAKQEYSKIATVADLMMKIGMFSEIYDQTLPSVAAIASIYVATYLCGVGTECMAELGPIQGVDPVEVSNFAGSILSTFNWLLKGGGEGILNLVNDALENFPVGIPEFTEEYIDDVVSKHLDFLE